MGKVKAHDKMMVDPDVITTNKTIQNITRIQAIATAAYLGSLGVPSLGIFIDTDVVGAAQDKYLTVTQAVELGIDDLQPATYVVMNRAPKNDEDSGEYQNLGEVIDTIRRAPNALEAAVRVWAMTTPTNDMDLARNKVMNRIAGSVENAVFALTADYRGAMGL